VRGQDQIETEPARLHRRNHARRGRDTMLVSISLIVSVSATRMAHGFSRRDGALNYFSLINNRGIMD